MEDKDVQYWIDISEYDLKVAECLLERGYYIYVGFMCHQSIEKMLKAIYVKNNNKTPPYTHKLDRLIEEAKISNLFSVTQLSFIDELTPLNIQARYPVYKDSIHKFIKKERAEDILQKTQELWKWLRQRIE